MDSSDLCQRCARSARDSAWNTSGIYPIDIRCVLSVTRERWWIKSPQAPRCPRLMSEPLSRAGNDLHNLFPSCLSSLLSATCKHRAFDEPRHIYPLGAPAFCSDDSICLERSPPLCLENTFKTELLAPHTPRLQQAEWACLWTLRRWIQAAPSTSCVLRVTCSHVFLLDSIKSSLKAAAAFLLYVHPGSQQSIWHIAINQKVFVNIRYLNKLFLRIKNIVKLFIYPSCHSQGRPSPQLPLRIPDFI